MTKHRNENLVLTAELFQLVARQAIFHLLPEYGLSLQNCWCAIDLKSNVFHVWTQDEALARRMGNDIDRVKQTIKFHVGLSSAAIDVVYINPKYSLSPDIIVVKEAQCPYLIAVPSSLVRPSSPQT